jgi:threonylcarbamoyladenosine tRNA methylthiotransferase MtaB
MKTFSIDTLGCKVNQYETQQILHLLEQLGLDHIDTADKPDMVVVNTCCVTNTASAKSRQYIRKALKLSPDADIVVCGCLPLIETGQIPISGKKLHLVKNRTNLAQTLTQIVNGQALVLDSQSLQIRPLAELLK